MKSAINNQQSAISSQCSVAVRLCTIATVILATVMATTSCNPEAKAYSGQQVNITIEQQQVSSGFIGIRFTTNKEAYYHVGIMPANEAPDFSKEGNAKSFMALMLDKAYADYLYWRSDLLEKGTIYVAEFASHSLRYGTVDYSFTLLTPDTEYMIFAFPVDAKTNKPDGRLFTQRVSTAKTSIYENLQFVYQVRGSWDYVYPTTAAGEIVSTAPWGGKTIDSLVLREAEYQTPLEFFDDLFEAYKLFQANDNIHFGIYVYDNDGEEKGSSDMHFEKGHIYYTGLALMDGYLSKKAYVIYKFCWEGADTQLIFKNSQSITTDW